MLPKRTIIRQVLKGFKQEKLLWSDAYAKKLFMWNTTLLFLEAILRKRSSVANIVSHLQSSRWMQKMAELKEINASSVNRRLSDLPTDLLKQVYQDLVAKFAAQFGLVRPLGHLGPLAAVDSTILVLGKVRGEWAYQQTGKNAVKMHTCFYLTGESSGVPACVALSTAMVADLDKQVTDALMKEEGVTYLLDRGYLDYRRYIEWARKGILFVARIKSNSRVRAVEERAVSGSHIERDAVVEVAHSESKETERLRLVEYTFKDDQNAVKRIRVLTNRWDATAEDIALMYRYRWKVEIFFKSMKQQLHLKKLYSSITPAAVWNQIYLNLIAYMLLETAREQIAPQQPFGEWISLLRHYLERPWLELMNRLKKPQEKTSRGRRKKGGRPRKHPKVLKPKRIVEI